MNVKNFDELKNFAIFKTDFQGGIILKKKINIPRGFVLIIGFPLDGCEAKFLTSDNIYDIKTVLAYDYEDGKP